MPQKHWCQTKLCQQKVFFISLPISKLLCEWKINISNKRFESKQRDICANVCLRDVCRCLLPPACTDRCTWCSWIRSLGGNSSKRGGENKSLFARRNVLIFMSHQSVKIYLFLSAYPPFVLRVCYPISIVSVFVSGCLILFAS